MSYNKIRFRCGGKIPKLLNGAQLKAVQQFKINHASELTGLENDEAIWNMIAAQPIDDSEEEAFDSEELTKKNESLAAANGMSVAQMQAKGNELKERGVITSQSNPAEPVGPGDSAKGDNGVGAALGQAAYNIGGQVAAGLGGETAANAYTGAVTGIKNAIKNGDVKGGVMAGIAGAATIATSALDKAYMGDKNFDAQSQATDSAVHGVSGALMKTGNPYCIAAGAVIEGVNFLDKAGGQTTPGYNVNIDNSGYSTDMTSMESQSSRTGIFSFTGNVGASQKLQRQLEKRNNKVRMALDAAEISEDQKFEQEARMNSISNTIMNNQEALAGGYNTNALGM